jgi:LysR family hydrogen peroxide-inducible transcriptional activator
MNLRDLEYIVAVADLNSFSAAANACHVSQPSLSAQIKKVEQKLGAKIFERTKRSVRLSAFGHMFIPRARLILAEIEKIRTDARQQIDPFQGRLALGAIATVAPYLFPSVLQVVQKKAPDMTLVLKEGVTAELLKNLLDGTIDAAIVSLPTDSHAFESYKLFDDSFYLAVGERHPLAMRDAVSEEMLRAQKLILLEEEHCLRDQALSVCQGSLMQEDRGFRATSLETIRQIVASGQGVTLMPELARRNNDGIAYIPVEDKNLSRQIGLVWRAGDERASFYKIFAGMIGE